VKEKPYFCAQNTNLIINKNTSNAKIIHLLTGLLSLFCFLRKKGEDLSYRSIAMLWRYLAQQGEQGDARCPASL
jgi:hypothetical protein